MSSPTPDQVRAFGMDLGAQMTDENLRTIRFALQEYMHKYTTEVAERTKNIDPGSQQGELAYEDLSYLYQTLHQITDVLFKYNGLMHQSGLDL